MSQNADLRVMNGAVRTACRLDIFSRVKAPAPKATLIIGGREDAAKKNTEQYLCPLVGWNVGITVSANFERLFLNCIDAEFAENIASNLSVCNIHF